MEFESLSIKISDLPKEISVSVPVSLTNEQLLEIVEDLRGQILYNSRNDEETSTPPEVNVTVVEKLLSSVIFRASV
ncbi:MAG: hypothetical protein HOP07_15855 [Bacteriovoracaceae bacterium]|nr:hypothetical protein [Bacteriovoracaceae bacterium]